MTIPENLIDPFPHPDLIDSEHMEGLVRPEEDFEPNGPIPRPPSKLPPPAHATLSFKLGKRIGFGLTGIVYEAIDVRVAPSSEHNITLTGYLPPLVVKLGRSNRCMSMAREAWFYREMECLQGIAIARCYGTFDLEVPRDMLVEPWQDPINSTDYDNDYEELPDFEEYPEEALEEKEVDPHPMLKKLVAARNRLCITVLERLGPALESGVVHPPEVKCVLYPSQLIEERILIHLRRLTLRSGRISAPCTPISPISESTCRTPSTAVTSCAPLNRPLEFLPRFLHLPVVHTHGAR